MLRGVCYFLRQVTPYTKQVYIAPKVKTRGQLCGNDKELDDRMTEQLELCNNATDSVAE